MNSSNRPTTPAAMNKLIVANHERAEAARLAPKAPVQSGIQPGFLFKRQAA